jgi:hypothetical protein
LTQQQIEKRRKLFFIGISLLATAIALASFGATYAIKRPKWFRPGSRLRTSTPICRNFSA